VVGGVHWLTGLPTTAQVCVRKYCGVVALVSYALEYQPFLRLS
jgi:hypothetical protein